MSRLVTAAQMRELEAAAVAAGDSWPALMERAGAAVAQLAVHELGSAGGRHVLVLIGPGNNGGDGLVLARHVHDAGAQVALYCWNRVYHESDTNWQLCRARGLVEVDAAADPERTQLLVLLQQADLLVDALLGMGLNRGVSGELATIIATVNQHASAPVLAIDLPTGVDSDRGTIPGAAIRADLSVATGLLKRGLLLYPARALAGRLAVVDLNLPQALVEAIMSETLDAARVRALLPARPDDSHKGSFGKLMVLAGSLNYPGAAYLATLGAYRAGAGLVTLAASRALLGMPRAPEVTLLPLPDLGMLGPSDVLKEFFEQLAGYDALLVGPGLGQDDAITTLFQRVLGVERSKTRGRLGFHTVVEAPSNQARPQLPPTIIDADGLNILAKIDNWPELLPAERAILTPHPGEMARLLKTEQLDQDRVSVAEQAARDWQQIVVLKGATTVVATPDGRSFVHDGANPALATAGTGDVLAGVIGALIAQGITMLEAALLGVYLHGAAGRLVRDEFGDTGTIASDLLAKLPLAIRELRRGEQL